MSRVTLQINNLKNKLPPSQQETPSLTLTKNSNEIHRLI